MGVRYTVNAAFFDRWSAPMAYVLGYLYADGSLEYAPYIRGRYVRVSSVDKDRVEAIRALMEAAHPVVKEKVKGNRKPRYLLRVGNRVLYEQLEKIGMTPNKSLSMRLPAVPKRFFGSFLRGYFDGDGCVFLQLGKGRDGHPIIKRLSVIFTSGSEIFLKELGEAIRRYSGNNECRGHLYNGTRSKQLWYFTQTAVMLFEIMYKHPPIPALYMRRKYDIFEQYFLMRPERVSPRVRKILEAHRRLGGEGVTRRSAKPLRAGSSPARASRKIYA